jgi:filamentous hemagglutinin family protein
MVSGAGLAGPPSLIQLPVGGTVSSGIANFSTTASTMTINQSTSRALINWNQFDIGANATVNFNQPSTSSVTLNQINSPAISQIYGHLNSNGQVYLINPSGIYFSPTASVSVGSIAASTDQIGSADFMNGGSTFISNHKGSIINDGTIKAATGGYIALLAPEVINNGMLLAQEGTIALIAGGQTITLNFDALTSLQSISVKPSLLNSLIDNNSAIRGPNGALGLTPFAFNKLNASVINSGIIEANGITKNGGRIILQASDEVINSGAIHADAATNLNNNPSSADTGKGSNGGTISLIVDPSNAMGLVKVGGNISANGGNRAGNGGSIETSAQHVQISADAKISTAASNGITGNWTIDPPDFTVALSGGDVTGATLSTNLASTNVVILSSLGISGNSGNINVNDSINWSSNSSLTLNAQNNIYVNSPITSTGTSAKLILQYGQQSVTAGNLSNYFVNAPINLSTGNNFSTQLGYDGPTINYFVINALGSEGSVSALDLQGINGALTGNFALGSNIDATITSSWNSNYGFAPIGSAAAGFSGNLDGLGHTITNLSISQSGNPNIGLIGASTGTNTIQNLGLIGGTTLGGAGTGGIIGNNDASIINNSYNTGSVIGGAGTGGLVGSSNTGKIINSYATGVITGAAGTGGVLGSVNSGIISSSYATGNVFGNAGTGGLLGSMTSGSVSGSFATGSVNGAAGTGGLIGSSTSGNVTDSYATGNVIGAAGTGGLIGSITSGAITNSYASGGVAGGAGTGAIVGATSGPVNNSFWNITTAPISSVGGGSGLTNTQMLEQGSFAGWDFSNTWIQYSGQTFPLLRSFMTPITVTASNQAEIYSGQTFAVLNTVSYSIPKNNNLLGAVNYGGSWNTAINVGVYSIVPSGLYSNQTGYIIEYASGDLRINTTPLVINGSNALTTYNTAVQTNSLSSLSYTGLMGTDTLTGVSGLASGVNASATAYPDHLFAATGTGLSNYAITYTNGSLSIGQASLTVTGSNNSVQYNASAQTNTGASYSGAKGSDAFTITGYASATNYNPLAYPDQLSLTGSALSNYKVAYNNGSLSITQAPLNVIGANTLSVYVGATINNSISPLSSAGLLGTDTLSGVSGLASGVNASTTAYPDHLFAATGNGLSNYAITYTNGSLTIGQAPLNVTGANTISTYSATTIKNSISAQSFAGLKGSDTLTGVSGLASGFNASATAYPDNLFAATGTGLSNYAITYTNGSLTIGQAPLNVTGANTISTYSAKTINNSISAQSFAGLKGSDTLTGVSGLASGVNASATAYPDHLFAATGTGLSNYAITYTDGSLSIGQASLIVTGSNNLVQYNASAQTNTGASYSGAKGSDAFTITGYAVATNYNPLAYLDQLSVSGTALSNYSVVYNNGSLGITQAPLNVIGANTVTTYGAAKTINNSLSALSFAGLMGTDTLTGVSGLASGINASTTVYSDHLFAATGNGLSNYAITYTNGSLEIDQAPLNEVGVKNGLLTGTKPVVSFIEQTNVASALIIDSTKGLSKLNNLQNLVNSSENQLLDFSIGTQVSNKSETEDYNVSVKSLTEEIPLNNVPINLKLLNEKENIFLFNSKEKNCIDKFVFSTPVALNSSIKIIKPKNKKPKRVASNLNSKQQGATLKYKANLAHVTKKPVGLQINKKLAKIKPAYKNRLIAKKMNEILLGNNAPFVKTPDQSASKRVDNKLVSYNYGCITNANTSIDYSGIGCGCN